MSEKSKDLAKEINEIYQMISSLSVSGDAVDLIAAVRFRLQKIYKEVSEDANAG